MRLGLTPIQHQSCIRSGQARGPADSNPRGLFFIPANATGVNLDRREVPSSLFFK